MTAEMPSTKPNIMITARLLLMPVFRSVELNVVLCAKADTAVEREQGRDGEEGRSRACGFLWSEYFFHIVSLFFFVRSADLPPNLRETCLKNPKALCSYCTKHREKSVVLVRAMNTTTGHNEITNLRELDALIAARNSRPVPSAAARGLRAAARRTQPHQARPAARKFSPARTDGRGKNGNGRRR